ncbi:hypothetical protein OAS75_00010 [Candidatus Pelagibacter sp.]|jgi:hypothetical protein|nr:hypothetical protein [Candidatus Pelagibacter sp.]
MDEEITIIDNNTRNEQIINFFKRNKKSLIILSSILIIILISFFTFGEVKKQKKIKLADQFNLALIQFDLGNKIQVKSELIKIINKKDKTYSPLSLYFLIDNNLIQNKKELNNMFDLLIDKTSLDPEIQKLLIYKKALYNSNFLSENQLIKLLNPIINSESIWKSHALYLLAEYFYKNNEKEKAKEFFNQIIILSKANSDIKIQSQKRLNRDIGE